MLVGRISGLERLLECPGHTLLRHAGASQAAVDAADHGTRLHQLKEGRTDVYLPTERDEDLQWLVDRYAGWQHEIPVSYEIDSRVGRLHQNEEELQARVAGEGRFISGHIDGFIDNSANGMVFVNDLKTSQVPVPLDDAQLMGYAMVVTSAIFRSYRDKGQLVPPFMVDLSVLHWPRSGQHRERNIEKTGKPYSWYSRHVTVQELKDYATRVSESLAPDKLRKLSFGAHCTYCPAEASCPRLAPPFTREVL